MDDLITWLREQLDVDERVARDAGGEQWQPHPRYRRGVYALSPAGVLALVAEVKDYGPDISASRILSHVILWDPARVLAELDAKRRIMDQLELWLRGHDPERADEYPGTTGGVGALLTVVRLLALPYADHEGYREEWRP